MSAAQSAPVLLTGFAPFDGQAMNASWLAVQEVARTWGEDAPLVVERLPVSFERGPDRLLERVERYRPRLVVAVGEAGGRSAVSLERVAVNVLDSAIPDADGRQPVDEPVEPDGPVGRFSGLPLRRCLAAVQRTGVPAEISGTAGAYVCNATFFRLMGAVGPGTAAGFVHVPRTPAQVEPGAPAMVTVDAALALTAVLRAALA
ncbi:pyroglutamyl-peptidase I [Isoptericola sp. b441]|uniref:Pyroglutamyl-peptidase I n=1 Tax=Actinotalea lenta TaxID=3064654 RepID=A0ABT9D9S5_9CELL|nr:MULTISPECIES: pyroglutamyl-peptidase I [unclassified Isoptericola]MDO8107660.1 pyroglutamyl-peptidase I [Isoptericola sp. b441]MDO8120680.1 pyroglutamyl-peptidase I [Isoptericola sp. b490]